MHELLVSRGFVRRADAPDLAEVKADEAIADAAAAAARKERADAAAKRRQDRAKEKVGATLTSSAGGEEHRAGMARKREFDSAKRKDREKEAKGDGEL
ncbi:unnamed protein product [Hapterophycus canaliculatus]